MVEGYTFGRKIGEGTFGSVYEAFTPEKTKVAVKVSLRPLSDASTKEAMLMQNEIEAMRRLAHPSLVAVHDAGFTADGRVFIAMELVEGEPLDRYLIHREKLDAIEAMRLVSTICDAVAVCHELDILHLDLKPQNIILTDPHEPRIKVLDFGLAHVTTSWRSGREASGTPYYMSPERFEAAPPDRRDDLYALGVILYELLTGDVPFRGESLGAIYAAKCQGKFTSASSKNSGTPKSADRLIASLIQPDRASRPNSAKHLADELSELAFQTLAGFSRITPQPRPMELISVPGQLPLVGRERELDALLETTRSNQTIAGSGTVVIGEAGVGKSRLLSRFLDDLAETTEVAVGYGRCRELSNALPYSPWREAIGRLAEANPSCVNALAPSLAPISNLLSRLVPELSARLTPDSEEEDEGTPVAVALTALLESVGAKAPCVVVIDDLQWADAGSRDVLDHLAEVGVPAGITIIATSRVAHVAPDGFSTLALAPLEEAEGDELIGLGIGSHDGELIGELKTRVPLLSTGNPLVTIQVLRQLEALRCLVRESGGVRIDHKQLERYEPPKSIRAAIAASIGQLTKSTRRVLAVGALLGRSFRCEDLYNLAVFERAVVKQAFNEALAAQVLSRSSCGRAAIFIHETIREELTETLGALARRQLHLRIARVLSNRKANASELAHHFELGGDSMGAARTHLQAGREARALYAIVDASEHLERATASALRSPPSKERDRVLLSATFELIATDSQIGNTEETLAHLDRCKSALREPSLEARIALEAGYARVFYVRGQFDRAEEHGDNCLRLANGDPRFSSYTLIPLALNGRGKAASGRFGPASDVLATVAELAEEQGEWVELAHSTGVRGLSLAFAGRYREAHDCVDRSIEIAHHIGDPIRMVAGLFYRTVIAEAAFDLELGLAASTHALRYAADRKIGGMYFYLTTLFAGRQQFHSGELERAKLLLTRSLETGSRLEIAMGRGWNYAFLGDVFFAEGELSAARSCYEHAIAIGRTGAGDDYAGPAGQLGLAHCIARQGGSDQQIDAIISQALARSAAVGNLSLIATIRDRMTTLWSERGRIDRSSRAEIEARDAFLALRVNRRAWCPGLRRDSYRRRRSPSRHPTLIGPAAAP